MSAIVQGPMTLQPNVFGNHYYTELINGGGQFFSDKTLLQDPDTQIWVCLQTYAKPSFSILTCHVG